MTGIGVRPGVCLVYDQARDQRALLYPEGVSLLNETAGAVLARCDGRRGPAAIACRGCPRREVDFGGCRCQAYQLVGDAAATDPACQLSPHHDQVVRLIDESNRAAEAAYTPRRFSSPGRRS